MRVSHFFEFESHVTGGIYRSVQQQRKALERRGVEILEKPDVEADILHLNIPGPRSAFLAWRAKWNNTPVVMHSHVTADEWEESFRFLKYLKAPLRYWLGIVYPMADVLICPSEYNRGIVEKYAPDTDKTVMTNGVDVERLEGFEDLRDEYLERYSLEPPVVFCVGHVFRRKGLGEFVDTARKLPEVDFVWFGYLDRSLKDSKTLELVDNSPENCQFTGYVEDIRGAYAAGDIFFFPTREDNEGIALLEAMATSKTPVIRDIDLFDHFEDRKECLKFKDDPLPVLEEAIEKDELRETVGNGARSRIDSEFRLEAVGEKLRDLYQLLT